MDHLCPDVDISRTERGKIDDIMIAGGKLLSEGGWNPVFEERT